MSNKYIPVKGVHYKVIKKKDLVDDDGDRACGLCDRDKKIIYIDAALKGEEYKLTLLHETIHAALGEAHIDEVIDLKTEEMIVANIEDVLGPYVRITAKYDK